MEVFRRHDTGIFTTASSGFPMRSGAIATATEDASVNLLERRLYEGATTPILSHTPIVSG